MKKAGDVYTSGRRTKGRAEGPPRNNEHEDNARDCASEKLETPGAASEGGYCPLITPAPAAARIVAPGWFFAAPKLRPAGVRRCGDAAASALSAMTYRTEGLVYLEFIAAFWRSGGAGQAQQCLLGDG